MEAHSQELKEDYARLVARVAELEAERDRFLDAIEGIISTLSTPGSTWQIAGVTARDIARNALNP